MWLPSFPLHQHEESEEMCINVRGKMEHIKQVYKNMKRERRREGADAAEPDRQEGEVSTYFTESEDDD